MAGVVATKELIFNVEEPQEEATNWATYYRGFVELLRRSYLPLDCPFWVLGFDVVLRSNSHQIKLRLDRCNYYPIGYEMETPRRWLEFGWPSDVKGSWRRSSLSEYYIPGAFLIGMSFTYENLEKECRQTVESITLGQRQLAAAVDILATSTCTTGQDWARSLIIVTLMICEASRFSYFSDYLAARYLDNLPAPQWMRKPLDKYDRYEPVIDLRQCIIPDGEDPRLTCKDRSRLLAPKEGVSDCHLLGEGNPDIGPCDSESSDVDYDDLDLPISLQPLTSKFTPQLQSLSDVFFVRVSCIEGKHSGTFSGVINICDGNAKSQCIYTRTPEESLFVQSGDLLSLTGPRKPIRAEDSFFFALALMGEGSQCALNFSSWNGKFDQPLIDEYYGEYCTLSVCYIALQTAMYATLTVTFIDKERKGCARIYGQISAHCGDFGYEIVLFQKKAEEHIDARPGKAIRLLRNVVSVPWNSSLILRADLFEYSDTSFDQEVAKGVMEFPLQNNSDLFEQIMHHDSGKVRVKVVWRMSDSYPWY